MAINPPKDGDIVKKRDIEAMFEEVRATVNNLSSEHISRAGIGPEHFEPTTEHAADAFGGLNNPYYNPNLGGVVTGFGEKNLSPSVDGVHVDAIVTDATSISDITSNWLELTGLRLDNNGNSYYLLPGKIVVAFSIRLREQEDDNGDYTGTPSSNDWVDGPRSGNPENDKESKWFFNCAATYKLENGTETLVPETVGGVRMEFYGRASGHTNPGNTGNPSALWNQNLDQEQNISFWYVLDTTAEGLAPALDSAGRFTLDFLKIYVARSCNDGMNLPNAAISTALSAIVSNGHHNFTSFFDR